MRDYHVYIMTNRSGTLYTGVTNDLERRVSEHKLGLSKLTKRYRITKLVYYETTSDITSAIEREKEIKGWSRDKKLALIRCKNAAMKDLAWEPRIRRPTAKRVPLIALM